jgi:hypothetical protein
MTRTISRGLSLTALCLGMLAAACGPSGGSGDDDDDDGGGGDCVDGARRCDGTALQQCQDTAWTTVEQCANACDVELGCVLCVPGTGTCNGDVATECLPDGSGFRDVFCDPVQGMACGPDGVCTGACSPNELGQTYFGCDYYPTITGNPVANTYDFAVVVANTSTQVATVTIDGGALGAADTFTVPGGAAVVRNLPWVPALKLCNQASSFGCTGGGQPTGALVSNGAYHLRTDVPVTVYQFNPIQYTEPGAGENSYTNDASLLFPTSGWRQDHYAVAWNNLANLHPSLLTVTAHQDNTQVTITTKGNTPAVGGAPAFTANVPQTITLNAGDVLQLGTLDGDMSGSRVQSDKPVQVIGGHYCANIPDTAGYCDHLEDLMLSVDALGAEYVINAPAVTTIPNGKQHMVRIVATEPNTTLTYDPPQAGAPASIANAGDWVQITDTTASFKITADKKILVGQFMEGSTVAGNTGDPSMALAVPIDQFRTEYLFHAPTNYETNYVDITAPVGATVTLDGVVVGNWQPIGTSGMQLARITPLGNGPTGDGNHLISSSMGFGISVYGYGQDTSYWYPGGLDLKRVVVE